MHPWQTIIILLYGSLNSYVFLKGMYQIKHKKNTFGLTGNWAWLGSFVWGDTAIISPFWILICLISLLLNDWLLFPLAISMFWVVRSFGEMIYWLNEQFTNHHRNPPQTLKFYSLFHNDSIWFIYQLFWQCILVLSLILTIYLAALWLKTI